MSDDHISVREFIERVLAEREKALVLFGQTLQERLNHMNARDERAIEERKRFLDADVYRVQHQALTEQVASLRSLLMWMMGCGAALVALAGVFGWTIGHGSKP